MKIPAFSQMLPTSQTNVVRSLTVPVLMGIDELFLPLNWAHVSAKVKIGEEVIVIPEDRSWRLHLLIVDVGLGFVEVSQLHRWVYGKAKPNEAKAPEVRDPAPDGYKIDFAPKAGWRAFTVDPLIEIARDCKNYAEAHKKATEHYEKASRTIAA